MIRDEVIKPDNKKANNLLYLFVFIGITPLFIILGIHFHNPGSVFLNNIATYTKNIPSITSSYNPIMTKVMDIYGKTAPLLSLFLFILTVNIRKTVNAVKIRTCILSILIYIAFIYLFYFKNIELTTTGRPLRLMSNNDFLLLIIYSGLYFITLLMTYSTLFIPSITLRALKKRQ